QVGDNSGSGSRRRRSSGTDAELSRRGATMRVTRRAKRVGVSVLLGTIYATVTGVLCGVVSGALYYFFVKFYEPRPDAEWFLGVGALIGGVIGLGAGLLFGLLGGYLRRPGVWARAGVIMGALPGTVG